VTPDTKDWTWVITQPCPDCGLDAASVEYEDIPRRITENAAAWVEVLQRPDVRARPRPQVWSPLASACHVRDVLVLFDQRLQRRLADQDATAVHARYDEQDPAAVAEQIPPAAAQLAHRFAQVTDRSRAGRRSDGAVFTVDSFARYLLHDPVHHLHDVGSPGLSQA